MSDVVRMQLSGATKLLSGSRDELLVVVMTLMRCEEHGGQHHFAVINDGKGVALSETAVDCLKAQGLLIPTRQPEPEVPFVAIASGEDPPWIDQPLTCPECGAGPLELQESTATSGPGDAGVTLRYISHCGKSWMRGPID